MNEIIQLRVFKYWKLYLELCSLYFLWKYFFINLPSCFLNNLCFGLHNFFFVMKSKVQLHVGKRPTFQLF